MNYTACDKISYPLGVWDSMKVDLRSDYPETPPKRAEAARVMVVDDDPFVRTVIADALSATGAIVKTYASGNEALAEAGIVRPDLVLLDLRMQGMDGRATAQALRQQYAAARMIFLTADGNAHDEMMRAGAAGVIAKPFDPANVVDQIQHLLGRASTPSHAAQFDAIAVEFRESLAPTIAAIKDAWNEMGVRGWHKSYAETILAKAHMLAGSAGLFHMHGVGTAADRIEGTLRDVLEADAPPSAATLARLKIEIFGLEQACRESVAVN